MTEAEARRQAVVAVDHAMDIWAEKQGVSMRARGYNDTEIRKTLDEMLLLSDMRQRRSEAVDEITRRLLASDAA